MLSPASRAMFLWRAAVLMLLFASLLACNGNSNPPDDEPIGSELPSEVILQTDSDEWRISIIAESLYYDEAVSEPIPNPFRLPTKAEAQVLRHLSYPHDERFVTSDGYTFSLPSASVSKAGSKTKYSVLGLWRRPTRIQIEW